MTHTESRRQRVGELGSGILLKILVPVVVAIVASTTAPWWWSELRVWMAGEVDDRVEGLEGQSPTPRSPVTDRVQQYEGAYLWQTTGGSIGPIAFGDFTARESCGAATASSCRERARESAARCMRTQWENRWIHHPRKPNGKPNRFYKNSPPRACLNASQVSGYDLSKTKFGTKLASAGDIKSRLEAEVCCLYGNGAYQYKNNERVHVRLIAHTKSSGGNSNSQTKEVLSPDYKVNCAQFREQHCRIGSLLHQAPSN